MIVPKGKLVIIGGAVDLGSKLTAPEQHTHPARVKFFEKGILKRIVTESRDAVNPLVEVITTASQIPHIVGPEYIKAFKQLDVNRVNVLDIKTREEAALQENLERIQNADIVMFSGGDQLKLTSIFGGTSFLLILKKRYRDGDLLIAGTSAGAAAASTCMIYNGESNEALVKGEVQITGGLGFIDSAIIDTHFVQRGRIGRLLYAVASNPGMMGIGLGEDAGLLITDGHMMEAIGSGLIMLVDGKKIVKTNIYEVEVGGHVSIENMKVHVISMGDRYDLSEHRMFIKPVPIGKQQIIYNSDTDG
ncbi:cyanophycinase [Mucilaginibacter sp. HD30]